MINLAEDPTKPKGLNHDEDLIWLGWEVAEATDWRNIPRMEEIAAHQPSWIRDLLYAQAEVRRQLSYIEGEQEALNDKP